MSFSVSKYWRTPTELSPEGEEQRRRSTAPERWFLVGDPEEEAFRAASRTCDAKIAAVLSVEDATASHPEDADKRLQLLARLQHSGIDRVVLTSGAALDAQARPMIWTLRSLGARMAVVPEGLGADEGRWVHPHRVCGMELFEVGGRGYAGHLRAAGIDEPRVSVVFTTLNEAENVGPVFARLPHDIYEVILVDGHSKDGTIAAAKAARPDVRTYSQFGRGKGDALRAGFAAATGDIIVALDADGSTLPEEIPLFVSALMAGADFVKASRTLAGGGSDDLTTIRRLGNRGLTTTFNILYGTHYTDLCYGFNAFWRSTLADLSLSVPGFEIEAAMHARAALSGLRVSEIPSFEHSRLSGAGALVPSRDGVRILRTILGFRGMSVHDPFTIPFDRIGAARWFEQAAGVAALPLEVP